MPWIECHDTLFDNPKALNLAGLMHLSNERAVMGLLRFWLWCLSHAPEGDLRGYTPTHIARAFRVRETRGEHLVRALIETGWLDASPYLRVHNWWKYMGPFLQNRYKRKPDVWRRIKSLYEATPPLAENPATCPGIPEIRRVGGDTIVIEYPNWTGTAPEHQTKPDQTLHNQNQNHHPPTPLLQGKGGDGSFDDVIEEIRVRTKIQIVSPRDREDLLVLYARRGPELLEACTWLHGGVKKPVAYLRTVLERQDRLENIAASAR